jgi:transcriptional regulator with GAF, ATPase, and Fis domain
MDDIELSPNLRISRDLAIAGALLALGRAEEVLPTLAETPRSRVETVNAYRDALRGRAHLAIARRYLGAARDAVPAQPDALVRLESGAILLASAGEDLDPDSFGRRRSDLDHAARLLRGSQAADAATLRDRLLEGPGANLEGIVELTEAMHDPRAFPGALARLVGEALGAYRVLIMVAIPGLGRQVTYTELSGSEAAGIGREVLRRVKKPDDHWLAHNAFADPHLRETSQTVRTFELKSLLAVAIPQGDKAVGALYVDDLHRTNRFTDDDVAILKRLASGVGRMLPLLATSRRGLLPEPRDLLGVLLSDRGPIRELESAVEMMRDRPQLNLLVSGPTGAGKSVLARRVARDVLGKDDVEAVVLRRGDPQFLITQLTGAKQGEYTGALTRDGAIQRCLKHDRVLFLDEVQNLDDTGQQILLPLLELPQRYFGGLTASSTPIERPLHIILGTNAEVSKGQWADHFREDLWYRMSTVHVALPPLRDRSSEAVYRYLRGMLEAAGAPPPEAVFDTAALHRLTSWEWPGNLRQLQQVADRAASLHQGGDHRLRLDDLSRLGVEEAAVRVEADAEGIDQSMVDAVWQALRRHQFVQSKAAQ